MKIEKKTVIGWSLILISFSAKFFSFKEISNCAWASTAICSCPPRKRKNMVLLIDSEKRERERESKIILLELFKKRILTKNSSEIGLYLSIFPRSCRSFEMYYSFFIFLISNKFLPLHTSCPPPAVVVIIVII